MESQEPAEEDGSSEGDGSMEPNTGITENQEPTSDGGPHEEATSSKPQVIDSLAPLGVASSESRPVNSAHQRLSTRATRMSKLFIKDHFTKILESKETTNVKHPSDKHPLEKSEQSKHALPPLKSTPSYKRIEELNDFLKKMKVDKFRAESHHLMPMDPSCLDETDDSSHHPFMLLRKQQLASKLAVIFPAGTQHLPLSENPELAEAAKMIRGPTPYEQRNVSMINAAVAAHERPSRPTTKSEIAGMGKALSSQSLLPIGSRNSFALHGVGQPGHSRRSIGMSTPQMSLSDKGSKMDMQRHHVWTKKDEEEYQLLNKYLFWKSKRRSMICRNRWKKAANIIRVIHRFCKCIAILSREKESHLRTFADIGDEAADAPEESKFSYFDADFSSKKADVGEILCDLQCYPSFCSYPLVIQTKIARCGMFMPVGKRRVLIREGHEAYNWYFVLSGQAIETEKVEQEDGTIVQNTVKFITQGMTLGEEAILNIQPHCYTVTTRKNMQLIRLNKEHFYEVFRQSGQHSSDIPSHIHFLKQMPFMLSFPSDILLKHPTMCYQFYCRPNTILVKDSKHSEWIYVVRSGSCVIQMYIHSTKASWRDLQLALAHPLVNIDGYPLPATDTGPGKLPLQKKAYTLYQRMSAHDIEASDLNQVPALHMTRGGSKNVRHGLYLLTGGVNRMKCPWPLDFFDAMNRTAFTITLPQKYFPIEPKGDNLTESGSERKVSFTESDISSASLDNPWKRSKREKVKKKIRGRRITEFTRMSDSFDDIDDISLNNRIFHNEDAQVKNKHRARKVTQCGKDDDPADDVSSNNRVFLTAMDGPGEGEADSETELVRKGQPGVAFADEKIEDEKDSQDTETKEDLKNPDKKKKKSSAASVKMSATERRKQYVVPKKCRPPMPAKTWRKTSSPYDCVSPPVYVEIDVLTEGDYFGLDELQEPGWESRDHSGKLTLISRGAEVVMLNKRFFMSFADDKTQVAIRDCMRIYPTTEAVQTRYRLQLAWELYSQKVRDEFDKDLRIKGKKYQGTYFQPSYVNIGDPYKILKER